MSRAQFLPSPVLRSQEHPRSHCRIRGGAQLGELDTDGFSLWMVAAVLAPGTTVEWTADHGDDVVFVQSGAVVFEDGARWPTDSALIVEAGVAATMQAAERTHLIHFGAHDTSPVADSPLGVPESTGRCVHGCLGSDAPSAVHADAAGRSVTTAFYFDGTCPRCRAALLRVVSAPQHRAVSHTHSQDELIHVVRGSMQVGRDVVSVGETAAIPALVRYGFRAGPDGCDFINYRRDASYYVAAPGSEPILEGVAALHAT